MVGVVVVVVSLRKIKIEYSVLGSCSHSCWGFSSFTGPGCYSSFLGECFLRELPLAPDSN